MRARSLRATPRAETAAEELAGARVEFINDRLLESADVVRAHRASELEPRGRKSLARRERPLPESVQSRGSRPSCLDRVRKFDPAGGIDAY